ncbi:hypothetical protein SmJEL517_g02426 [Synchytrium microbalum]|uniref:ABC transporter domain-containing protein n=1 Tax=Synchytrium microbalum TaxID=1806994 RepID=A0A507CBV9_9FUNG|nr:uncharacterized protein SmJEL517_g02426 [Synchytrium microbalum]TPX35033.1 hypothetical protein SmJEL517_g02426 [Synchytrium microbalum]
MGAGAVGAAGGAAAPAAAAPRATTIPTSNTTVPVNIAAMSPGEIQKILTPSCYISNGTAGYPISSTYSCLPHFYCPYVNDTVWYSLPQVCPSDTDCVVSRLTGIPCEPQGRFEPTICRNGTYCPDFRTQITCPQGYFCPTGSIAPNKCSIMSSCPEGSRTQVFYGGMVFCLLIDLVMIGAFFYLRSIERKRVKKLEKGFSAKASRRRSHLAHSMFNATQIRPGVALDDGSSVAPGLKDVSVLVDAFKRGMNHQELAIGFKFEDMGCTLKTGKVILQGVTGEIKPGRLTAIMGPSGAGKTTFMNVLMGKYPRTGGRLFINGREEAGINACKKIVGFVPQEDIMLREMTVRENILHSARTRLPNNWTQEEIEGYVDAILEALNLSHVAHTIIGDESTRGVSGGQRKRVNIGMELAAVPLAIFLDEPTSGLDSTAALSVAQILKSITTLGLTVVAVVHQPRFEIFELFDDVLMIAPGGRTAYLGPTSGVKSYYESMGFVFEAKSNAADVLMDILSGQGNNVNGVMSSSDLVSAWETEQYKRNPKMINPSAPRRIEQPVTPTTDDASSIRSQARSDRSMPISVRVNGEMTEVDPKTIARIPALLYESGEITEAAYKRLLALERNNGDAEAFTPGSLEHAIDPETGSYLSDDDDSIDLRLQTAATANRTNAGNLRPAMKRSNGSLRSAASDMGDDDTSTAMASTGFDITNIHDPVYGEEFWQAVQVISANRGAFWWRQMMYCHNRSLVQQYRQWYSLAIEVFVAAIAGVLMGVSVQQFHGELYHGIWIAPYSLLTPAPLNWLVPLYGLLLGIAITIAGAPAGVRVFGEEKSVYWREAAAGHSRSAYYVGKTLAAFYRFIVSSLHFTAFYVVLAVPLVPFATQWAIALLNFFGEYGLAAVISLLVRREDGALVSVIVGLIAAVFCGYGPSINEANSWGLGFVWDLSFNRWGAEALYTESLYWYQDVYDLAQSADQFGYVLYRTGFDLFVMVMLGLFLRAIAFVLLIVMNREKQK